MLATDPKVCDVTAGAYETTEEARMLLAIDAPELSQTARAVGEAAYYLSDTLEPEDRALLFNQAATEVEPARNRESGDMPADALTLLCDASGDVEEILRGPHASSELRIASRALRRAIGDLASYLGLATDDHDPIKLQRRWPGALRRDRSNG
jgi:hypothetical protein